VPRFPADLLRPIRRFLDEERGNIAMLFALFLGVGTALSALAVDEGALYLQRRQAQSAVDLAAITAARDPADGFALARAALADAGLIDGSETDAELQSGSGIESLTVDAGSYAPDPTVAVGSRFADGGATFNAVRIRFRQPGVVYFARSWGSHPELAVSAVASATPDVRFSVGSTLATLNGGLANAILNALLGANVDLSAVSYNGLLNAKVSLFGFLDALAQQLDISAGTYDDVLVASADQGAIAKALAANLTGADATAAQTLAAALGHNGTVQIGKLVSLGNDARLAIGTGTLSGDDADISALQLLAATGALSDGTHEVALNLGASVPGLTSLTMTLAVGEPQQFASWFALGPSGTIARTAQIRLKFLATLAGGAGLSGALVRLPLYLNVAYADAGVQSASCPAAGEPTGSAVIDAEPGIAALVLGDVADPGFSDFSTTPTISPATLVNLALLKVTASGEADIGQTSPTPLSFSVDDIENDRIHEATTTDFTQSLTASLLSTMTVSVSVLGLGFSSSSVTKALADLVAPLGPVLDSTIATTLDTLGLRLGIADVEVYGVSCSQPVLVQ
jgi:tight adherence protein G